eukprot:gnl/Dysnectes_brevis/60_a75_16244.p1 GENE.gnl/Dysnectes_brevis/60_a75_16244~~gnl/Dysnectes_brevis/60_a75_16244.p1  ORF type:complete len:126 (-),score=14.82 gnl/Dysnectes_brevis/60_a75_16244:89-424(-)
MPVKRRNHGRAKKNCGHVKFVRCQNCFRAVPKDKAIKRFSVRNMVDNSIIDDVLKACVIEDYAIPKLYSKSHFCVSCACHNRIVRVRSREDRKVRENPRRFRRNREDRPRK